MKKLSLCVYTLFFLFYNLPTYAQTPGGQFQQHSFQYTTAVLANSNVGKTVNAFSATTLPRWYTLSITGTATPVSVFLDGSLDQSNWSPILITTSYTGNVSNSVPYPFIYFRVRAASVTANNFVTATAVGVW